MSSIIQRINATLQRINEPIIRERLLIVKASFKKSLRDVAYEFGYTHGKVAYWKNRYKQYGLKGLYTKEKSGRPSKLNFIQIAKIRKKVRRHNIKHGWTTKNVKEYIKKEGGVTYTERHIQRLSHKWGLAQIKPRKQSAYSKKEDRKAFLKKTRIF